MNRRRLKLTTPNEVRKALTRVVNMVMNREITPQEANTIIYACNAVLGAIRTDEQQKKIDELERLILERQE